MGDEVIYLVVDFMDIEEMKIYGVYPGQLFELAKQHALLVAKNNSVHPNKDWEITYEFGQPENRDGAKVWNWHEVGKRITPAFPGQNFGTKFRSDVSAIIELSTFYDLPKNPTDPIYQ